MSLVVADTAAVTDVTGEAQTLADITGDDPALIEASLRSGAPFVVLSVAPGADTTQAINDAADALPGISVESRPLVAVGTTSPAGVRLLDAATLVDVSDLPTSHPVVDMALVTSLDQPTLFVGGGDSVSTITLGDDGPQVSDPLTLPGPVSRLVWNESADLVHVADPDARRRRRRSRSSSRRV